MLKVNLVELSARIKKLRVSQGLTLEQLADRAGIAKGMLSKIENFRVTPSLPTLAKLSETLGATISNLFEGLDHSPGGYALIWTGDPFPNGNYTLLVTPVSGSGNSRLAVVNSTGGAIAKLEIRSANGNLQDTEFSFMAIQN